MESVYLETSFISYLVSKPSRDLITAAHQQISSEWWSKQRHRFDCYVSQFVIDEASMGDGHEAQKRLELIEELNFLETTGEAELLAKKFMESGIIPTKAVADAAHIAVATVHAIDYVITWNCKHLANAHILKRLRIICLENGYALPDVCTPEALMENDDEK